MQHHNHRGDAMKVLFLVIDGVLNCETARSRRHRGLMPIEPRLARIIQGSVQSVPNLLRNKVAGIGDLMHFNRDRK
jgi:hypothetical protein